MDDNEAAERRVGSVLQGKWTLERLVGVGGMAAVYVARHKIGRLDAIKILHPEFARSEQIRARFEQEAHVLNRFKHPGAVDVRDLESTEDGAPFIVMELLEGEPLASRIRKTPPSVDDALRMADEVLDVLAAAHEQGIIHRDIKPDNLFVLPSGAIKVLDFGIAQLRSPEPGRSLKTKTGTTLGTVAYMPSEQLKGLDIDARADVYGVGATMFRMLALRTPHEAASDVELMMQVLTEPAPRLASVMTTVRADVARIVDRALAFDRDARFPDARSMQLEVRAARAAENAPMAEPLGPQSEVATRTPAHLSPVIAPVIATDATMAAAPESALLREALPSLRQPAPPSSAPSHLTRVSEGGVVKEARDDRALPIFWIIGGGALVFLSLVAIVATLAISALRSTPTVPSATTSAVAAPPAASPPPAASDEDRDEPRHPGPPPGHGHHKH